MYGLPKYDSAIVDIEYPHILKKPYESVMCPRSERIDSSDIINEINETQEYTADMFNTISQGSNPAASIGFGHSIMSSNAGLKRSKFQRHRAGVQGAEPGWVPEGGIMTVIENPRMPEDNYSENRRRIGYVDIDGTAEHSDDVHIPQPQVGPRVKQAFLVPVAPSATYNVDEQLFYIQPSRAVVYRATTAVGGVTSEFGPWSLPNPVSTTKHLSNRNLTQVLTPMFSTFVKVGENVVPIRFKDPKYLALQIQGELPLDIPLPDGGTVKLHDYRWTVVQNINAPSELIIELPVNLKDKPDISHAVSQISSSYQHYDHRDVVNNSKKIHTNITAPIVDQVYDTYVQAGGASVLGRHDRNYQNVSNAFEVLPGTLRPVRSELRDKPRLYLQPEPAATYPWNI